VSKKGRVSTYVKRLDFNQYERNQQKFSITAGTDKYISHAQKELQWMPGGMDFLLSLSHFDPSHCATVLDMMNSEFMAPLCETSDALYARDITVYNYLYFSPQNY
jgi:hypothetical protein